MVLCLPKGNSEELSEDNATYVTGLTPLALNRVKILVLFIGIDASSASCENTRLEAFLFIPCK